MNRHNRFTPQWVFLLCGTLLVFIALFLVLPVAISAEDTEPETVDAQSGAGWIYPEPVLDSGGADSLQLTSQQLDDLEALRRNSDIFLYGIFPVTVSLILLIWGAVWFYRTFIESGL